MKRKLIQTSCSELLVDTAIYDATTAYNRFSKMFNDLGWESNPPLSINLLRSIMPTENNEHENEDEDKKPEIVVYDNKGNRAWIECGENGYITTGFRFDSHCNHGDSSCFPIFLEAKQKLKGKVIACDGGSTSGYEEYERDEISYRKSKSKMCKKS